MGIRMMYYYFRIIPRKQPGTFVVRVDKWEYNREMRVGCEHEAMLTCIKRIIARYLSTDDFEIKFISQDIFLDEIFKDGIIEIMQAQNLKEQ